MQSPPKLGGNITPQEWLREAAVFDRRKGATMRAAEAEAIADWIDSLVKDTRSVAL
jgi:hypothetical protein